MKIAQITCVLPPYGGGIGMVAHSYADQLTERGHDVTVFVPRFAPDVRQADHEKHYKVKRLIPIFRMGLGAVLPQLVWRLWSFDVIHLHYPFFGSAFWVAVVKKLRGDKIKFVLSYHMDVELHGFWLWYQLIYNAWVQPFILRMADCVIVSSEDYVEDSNISQYYFQHLDKFVELPFGVPRFFKPTAKDDALLQKYGLTKDDKVALFVGGLDSTHFFKGVSYLIKAIALIPDKSIKALIVGEGNLKKQFQNLAVRWGVADRVKFSGYVVADELPKHYNLADVFVLPSIGRAESFGIVLLEAMACGKPVAASNLKGVRRVVRVGENGLLFEPRNSQDIADKVAHILLNPNLAGQFGAGSLRIIEMYRWRNIVEQLEKIYLDLIDKKN
ncbi:MAG: glycosyltransferase family 4 protein [Parcubacteria group bacterium]